MPARSIPRKSKAQEANAAFPDWVIPVAIVLLVLVAYIPAIRGDFIWDDDSYVTKNETLRTASGLWRIWTEVGATPQYYPLVFTSFWLEYHVWGLSPAGYHVVNILLHAASAILVWRIVLRLGIPGAWLAAMIFALHPVQVESVAWITERKNVLSGFFYLLSMLAFLRFSPLDQDSTSQRKWYFVSLGCFVAALFSKTVTATLPAAILLIYWLKLGRVRKRDLLTVLPMFVLGAGAGVLTSYVEEHHVGTKFFDWNYTVVDRMLIAGRVVWFYLSKLLWPAPLIFIYDRWSIDSKQVAQFLYPAAAILVLFFLAWQVKRWGRGPLVAALFFGGTLFPALGFIDVFPMRYSFVADHFQYLASLGPIVLAAAVVAKYVPNPSRIAAGFVLVGILGALTFKQCHVYEDLETLWRDTLAKNPGALMARNNLGTILQSRGQLDDAERFYKECLADPQCLDRADLLLNLAQIETLRGNTPRTIEYYQMAIAARPSFPKALATLGGLLHNLGRLQEALPYLERAVKSNPEYTLARNNYGSALVDAGRFDEAIAQLDVAIKLNPEMPEPHYNLGNALGRATRTREAEQAYESAIRLRPNYVEAHVNLANLLHNSGRADEAIAHLETALKVDPQHPIAHYAMANLLARQGRKDDAVQHYKAARLARPDLRPPPGYESP